MTAVDLGLRTVAQAHAVWRAPVVARFRSALLAVVAMLTLLALASWNPADPSLNAASGLAPSNWLGTQGATLADLVMQALGLAAWPAALLLLAFGTARALAGAVSSRLNAGTGRVQAAAGGVVALAAALSALAAPAAWPIAAGLGGLAGDVLVWAVSTAVSSLGLAGGRLVAGLIAAPLALGLLAFALGLTLQDVGETMAWLRGGAAARPAASSAATAKRPGRGLCGGRAGAAAARALRGGGGGGGRTRSGTPAQPGHGFAHILQ
ncbi:DNA translocase FtsK 4TM domain-containing protein, partial [Brevundimonas sp.]|uniref:DNA translocase FtsK 4TM domain-containing protein n=1 Tax=Brevundimonas sp. TaxID=1871086 RepID=UPI00391CD3D0